jgi:hypothetical protein
MVVVTINRNQFKPSERILANSFVYTGEEFEVPVVWIRFVQFG